MALRQVGVLYATTSLCFAGLTYGQSLDQKPIAGHQDDADIIPSDSPSASGRGKAAEIVLYPGARVYPDDLRAMSQVMAACSDDDEKETIQLPTDVCLSGEYYARDNIKVLESPRCADGFLPKMMFYQNRGCTGSRRKVIDDLDETTQRCLWSEEDISVPSYYWSLIYRCDGREDGAEGHQTATPASLVQNVLGGAPASMRDHLGTMFPCHSDFANRTRCFDVETGNCRWPLTSFGLESIEVLAPAWCKNGTRAQLALYEDYGNHRPSYMCNWGEMTLASGFMDVDDWMLKTCIDMSHVKLSRGGFGRALGVLFSCDGIHFKGQQRKEDEGAEEMYKQRGPRTSHNECPTSAGRWQWDEPTRPATFLYPQTETCVTLPKGQQVRVHEQPICPDGSPGRFATWKEPGCKGWPRRIEGVDSTFTMNCKSWNLQADSSYMFWCSPEGLTTEERNQGATDNRAVISLNECPRLDLKPGWTEIGGTAGPTIDRVGADDCFNVRNYRHWKMYSNARCKNGKPAKLAKYKGTGCRGKPFGKVNVKKNMMDACIPLCGNGEDCSAKFWCD